MSDKNNAVAVGKTPCEQCGRPSTVRGAGGKVLCSSCASLVKQGASSEPGLRQAADVMVERLTRE